MPENEITYSNSAPSSTAVVYDTVRRTVRPAHAASDAYFGLGPGENGTAPSERRRYAERDGYTWTKADGSPATGLQYVPGQRNPDNIPSPWSGL